MKRRYLVLLFFIAGSAVVLFGIFAPAIGNGGSSPEVASMVRLRQFAFLVREYADEHDGLLPNAFSWHEVMDPWIGIDINDPIYSHGKESRGDLFLLPIPWTDQRVPASITDEELAKLPFMYEDPELFPDRTSVAFWDGSVLTLDDEEFAERINTTGAVRLGPGSPEGKRAHPHHSPSVFFRLRIW